MNWVGGGDTFLHKGTKLPIESHPQSAGQKGAEKRRSWASLSHVSS